MGGLMMNYERLSIIFLFIFLIFGIALNVFKGLIYFGYAPDRATLTYLTTCKDAGYFATLFSFITCILSMKKHVEG